MAIHSPNPKLHELPTDMLENMLLDPDLPSTTIDQIEEELERRSDPHHDDTPSLEDRGIFLGSYES